MLNSLRIMNFRLFKALLIEPLGRVNLVAGRNNSGKTALLEALRIWASDADDTVVNAALKDRGEFTPGWIESYEALFYPDSQNDSLRIQKTTITRHRKMGPNNGIANYSIQTPGSGSSTPPKLNPNITAEYPRDGCIYIPFPILPFPLEQLWKKIALTPDYDAVKEIVRQADDRIIDIDVRSDGVRVRLADHHQPVSMGRLGDGIMQTLKMAIGLVSAKNTARRLLLIDEIEAGLHHSVQLLLWEKIFLYAAKWDLQVFATTHSQDAVRTFAEVAGRRENAGQGCYLRLEQDADHQVKAVVYDHQQLATSIEFDLETR